MPNTELPGWKVCPHGYTMRVASLCDERCSPAPVMVTVTLEEHEAEWLLATLNLVMKVARQWDALDGKNTGQVVVNKLMISSAIGALAATDPARGR